MTGAQNHCIENHDLSLLDEWVERTGDLPPFIVCVASKMKIWRQCRCWGEICKRTMMDEFVEKFKEKGKGEVYEEDFRKVHE